VRKSLSYPTMSYPILSNKCVHWPRTSGTIVSSMAGFWNSLTGVKRSLIYALAANIE
jgi:hypothetical protein